MSSEEVSGGVAVDSALVVQEVRVDIEASLNGSVGHDFSLDSVVLGRNVVDLGEDALVLDPVDGGCKLMRKEKEIRL